MPTILCYGDSNTFGTWPLVRQGQEGGHRAAARRPGAMAAEIGPGIEEVVKGHPSRTTVHDDPIEGAHRDGLAILPAVIGSHRPEDLGVLLLGTSGHMQGLALAGFDIAFGTARQIQVMRGSRHVRRVLRVCPPSPLERGCLAGRRAGVAARGRKVARWSARIAGRLGVGFVDAAEFVHVEPREGMHLSSKARRALGQRIIARGRMLLAEGPGHRKGRRSAPAAPRQKGRRA